MHTHTHTHTHGERERERERYTLGTPCPPTQQNGRHTLPRYQISSFQPILTHDMIRVERVAISIAAKTKMVAKHGRPPHTTVTALKTTGNCVHNRWIS